MQDPIQLWSDDISTFTTSLRNNIPNFDTYPDTAQDALFDMAYNLGIGGLLRYHNLLAACRAGDWDRAATESVRHGISIAADFEEDGMELSVRWLATELSAE